jgi:hypothetical protein
LWLAITFFLAPHQPIFLKSQYSRSIFVLFSSQINLQAKFLLFGLPNIFFSFLVQQQLRQLLFQLFLLECNLYSRQLPIQWQRILIFFLPQQLPFYLKLLGAFLFFLLFQKTCMSLKFDLAFHEIFALAYHSLLTTQQKYPLKPFYNLRPMAIKMHSPQSARQKSLHPFSKLQIVTHILYPVRLTD